MKHSFSRSAWDSALRLSTYGAQEKRPCGSSDQLSARLCRFASKELSITKCRRPRPSPRPCMGGEFCDVLYLLLSSSTSFYLLLSPSPY